MLQLFVHGVTVCHGSHSVPGWPGVVALHSPGFVVLHSRIFFSKLSDFEIYLFATQKWHTKHTAQGCLIRKYQLLDGPVSFCEL